MEEKRREQKEHTEQINTIGKLEVAFIESINKIFVLLSGSAMRSGRRLRTQPCSRKQNILAACFLRIEPVAVWHTEISAARKLISLNYLTYLRSNAFSINCAYNVK